MGKVRSLKAARGCPAQDIYIARAEGELELEEELCAAPLPPWHPLCTAVPCGTHHPGAPCCDKDCDRDYVWHADCPGVGGRYWALINIYRSPAVMFELTRLKKRKKKES